MTTEQTLAALSTDPSGLSEAEAGMRLAQYGSNQLPEARMLGPIHVFLRQFRSPLIYLLLIAGVLSLVIGDRWDAIFIFGVLLLNAAIGAFQELKADASARALRSLVPQIARVRRGGGTRDVPSEEIVPGDVVELESGVSVTADMRLIDAVGLEVDESTFTGESMPIAKRAEDRLDEKSVVADRTNMLHAGTSVVEGRALAVVTQTGAASQLGHIDRTLAQAASSAEAVPLVRRMAVLARQIALIAVALIVVLGTWLALEGQGWRDIVLLAIALAVAAIPEGLPIAVTVALSAAASRMARRNVIVRALPAVEGLGACTLIASDKTGTLTVNRLTVDQVALQDGQTVARTEWQSARVDGSLTRLAEAAGLCNEAKLRVHGSPVGDAVDVALLDFARENGCDLERLVTADRLSIVPYEPALRYAAVEADFGSEVRAIVKGAPETVLTMCRDADAGALPIAEQLAAEGYRVLALAEGQGHSGDGHIYDHLHELELLGFVGLTDPLRHGVPEAVAKCREAGVAVCMITGDHPATALAIARKLGMDADDCDVVTGEQLQSLATDSEEFAQRVNSSQIFARTEPAQKLAIVKALEATGHTVAVTGDGVNDGPALRMADIGIAMGRGGTDVARGASDLVLADDNFATIVAGIEEGRVTFVNIRKIVLFMLATGAAEILMFLLAISLSLPMPLTPVQLLWLNLVTNGVLDVTLGFGRGDGDELKHPPKRKLASLVDGDALILMLPGAILMTVIAVWVLNDRLALNMPIEDARNHVLLMVVTFQIAFLLSIRNLTLPFWRWHAPENGWMFVGMAIAVALQIAAMTVPWLQRFLDTAPVEMDFLVLCGGAALAVLLATEGAKRWLVHQQRQREIPQESAI
ncbi:cation-translocating P-type ATPase [Altererythrobacter lutimaris]|uniref:HAD-IC family P-type ATPase n=1 Tax=Altererythrobacter lutimaris TaxID=2743979 RepID=A0A850HFI8_9SPHN|nr:HAD-IC family P-type ATPase [Altererythrobacter lutimaris]NVE96006.1 HAD-IC family P-type ATPase [Altererythrobacter lutimaris]